MKLKNKGRQKFAADPCMCLHIFKNVSISHPLVAKENFAKKPLNRGKNNEQVTNLQVRKWTRWGMDGNKLTGRCRVFLSWDFSALH